MSTPDHDSQESTGPGYPSPQAAREQPPEQVAYVAGLYEGTGIDRPDFIAVVDVDPSSPAYGEIVNRTEMPNVGDELHHFGWNACSSACHSQLRRDTLIVPGFRSSRIHVLDVSDPRVPRIKHVIEGAEIKEKLGLSAPHTVHCMPGDIVTISMLGDADGNAPGGFAVLDARDFSVAERWEREPGDLQFMYDFWYQPRQNTLVSSEWGAPNTFQGGFDPADVDAGKYGRRLHFWDLERRAKVQTIDLGDDGLIPLEIRWQHDPDSAQGFVGATLSSNILRFYRDNGSWATEKVIDVGNEELEGWPLPGGVPGLITDLVLSLDDRDLFFSNWLHGDLRHYDVSDPHNPVLRSQVWLGGLLGRDGGHPAAQDPLTGGPQMLQTSLDGDRVYVSNSLYSTWDNQFYPELRGWLTKLDRHADGSFALDPEFLVDFHEQADGARPHEIHLPGGDCTTEIFQ
ncbi:MAG TPA: selenium-binding protein SBP56-related protein [Solirubrobacteraceae bacterium]|jgi:selenium-binding protein 1|nr:selenium-binding protein SBP56-related protein [Solirubrobacteraceae bacterium]